jgi:hypothetical protein
MPWIQHGAGSARYLIRSDDPARLGQCVDMMRQDEAIHLLDFIGPAGQPHTVVAEMPEEKARALVDRFGVDKVTIERDKPLFPYDSTGPD